MTFEQPNDSIQSLQSVSRGGRALGSWLSRVCAGHQSLLGIFDSQPAERACHAQCVMFISLFAAEPAEKGASDNANLATFVISDMPKIGRSR